MTPNRTSNLRMINKSKKSCKSLIFKVFLKTCKCKLVVFQRESRYFEYGKAEVTPPNVFFGPRCCWKYQKGLDESFQGQLKVISRSLRCHFESVVYRKISKFSILCLNCHFEGNLRIQSSYHVRDFHSKLTISAWNFENFRNSA